MSLRPDDNLDLSHIEKLKILETSPFLSVFFNGSLRTINPEKWVKEVKGYGVQIREEMESAVGSNYLKEVIKLNSTEAEALKLVGGHNVHDIAIATVTGLLYIGYELESRESVELFLEDVFKTFSQHGYIDIKLLSNTQDKEAVWKFCSDTMNVGVNIKRKDPSCYEYFRALVSDISFEGI